MPIMAGNDKLSQYRSLTDEAIKSLEDLSPKDEQGKREETLSQTIMRLINKAKDDKIGDALVSSGALTEEQRQKAEAI